MIHDFALWGMALGAIWVCVTAYKARPMGMIVGGFVFGASFWAWGLSS